MARDLAMKLYTNKLFNLKISNFKKLIKRRTQGTEQ